MKNTNPPAAYTSQQIADWLCVWNAIPDTGCSHTSPFRPMRKDRLFFLMYVAQGHYLATFGRPLFDGTLLATKRGPVVDDIGFLAKRKAVIEVESGFRISEIKPVDHMFLSAVWCAYQDWTDLMLAEIRHEKPFWGLARREMVVMTHEAMAYQLHPSKPVVYFNRYFDGKALREFYETVAKEDAAYLANMTERQVSEPFFTDADDESGVKDRRSYSGRRTEADMQAFDDELNAKMAVPTHKS